MLAGVRLTQRLRDWLATSGSATRQVGQQPCKLARSVPLGRYPWERVRRRAPRDRIPVGRVGGAEAELGDQPGDIGVDVPKG